MPSKVWQCKRLAVLHRSFRLPASYRHCRQPDFCPSRWFIGKIIRHFSIVITFILAVYRYTGPYKSTRSSSRSTSWGSHVRPLMVRSRRQRWMGNLTTWCWIHIWSGNQQNSINIILKIYSRIFPKLSITQMALPWYHAPISWWWRVTIGATIEMWLQFFLLQIIVTDVATR